MKHVWRIKAELESNYCAHCRRAIGRKGTYLIEDEKGKTLQVGRTCVKDFVTKKTRKPVPQIRSLASILADESHTDDMISSPLVTLSHAMCHLFNCIGKDEKEFKLYRECVRTLENCRRLVR